MERGREERGGLGGKKGCFTLNTSHVSTFTCAPKIAGRVVRLARLEQANDNRRSRSEDEN